MNTVSFFGDLGSFRLHDLNSTNICLVPKKTDASKDEDYRPISLMHSFAKILAKQTCSQTRSLGFPKSDCFH